MSERMSGEDQAMVVEALRRMKVGKPGIPGDKVIEFLRKLDTDWDQLGADMTEVKIREMFQRFVAEAAHVQR